MLILFFIVGAMVFTQRVVWGRQLPYYLQVKAELAAESAKLAAAKEAALKVPSLKEELARTETELLMAKARLGFTLGDKDSFLAAAQPKQIGVRVLLFRPLESGKNGSFIIQPFQVSVEGVYPQVEAYLRQLETLPALTQVRDLKLTVKPGATGEVEASFVLDFYDLGGEVTETGKAVALLPLGRSDIFLPTGEDKPGDSYTVPPSGWLGGQERVPANTANQPSTAPPPVRLPESRNTVEGTRPEDKDQSETPEYTFPSRGKGRIRAGAPWLEGIRVLRNVGPFYYPASRKIAIGGQQFEHGIVVDLAKSRSKAEAVLDLQAGYLTLQGFIGVEDGTMNSSGGFILRLKGDERELFTSPPLQPGGYPQYIEVDVTGVNRLSIQVEWKEAGPGDYDRLKVALADMIFLTTKRNI